MSNLWLFFESYTNFRIGGDNQTFSKTHFGLLILTFNLQSFLGALDKLAIISQKNQLRNAHVSLVNDCQIINSILFYLEF